ncbi:C-factor [Ischnura elegans]|uniref:C-factor n=1 Tax=Ischnura elegans TaxID=197161 RepID=UPI001ED89D5C|nr:C-factor [Ischnura elegans]
MKSILVTGCNRGIGLELIKQLVALSKPPQHVLATVRQPDKAKELQELASANKSIHILQIDLKDLKSYKPLSKEVGEIVGDDGLNVLLNSAGISSKFARLQYLKAEQLEEHFLVNTIAPTMLTKALLPLIKVAASRSSSPPGLSKGLIVNMSSILGSISSNTTGGLYPYRASKSALNAITRSLSLEVKDDGIIALSLHPGWVKTDMGGPKAPLTVQESVSKILQTLSSLEARHNGQFIQFDGQELPW